MGPRPSLCLFSHSGSGWPSTTERDAYRIARNRVWAAMALCWLGDIAPLFRDTASIGLVSFLLGHVLFIFSLRQAYRLGSGPSTLWVRAAASGLLAVEGVAVVRALWEPAGDLGPAVAVYAFVITIMATLSWFLAPGPGVRALRLGSTAFVASDMILAFGRFGDEPIAHGHLWVMATYILAQGPWRWDSLPRLCAQQPAVGEDEADGQHQVEGLSGRRHAEISEGESSRELTGEQGDDGPFPCGGPARPQSGPQPDEVASEYRPEGGPMALPPFRSDSIHSLRTTPSWTRWSTASRTACQTRADQVRRQRPRSNGASRHSSLGPLHRPFAGS